MKSLTLSVIALAMICLSTTKATSQNFGGEVLPTISFSEDFRNVNENAGVASFEVEITEAIAEDVDFTFAVNPTSTALAGTNWDVASFNGTIPAGQTSTSIDFIIYDNASAENEVFVAFDLIAADNANVDLSADPFFIFIQDDEVMEVEQQESITLEYLNSYLVEDGGSAEIVAYEPNVKRLYVLNSESTTVNILDFSDPSNISEISAIDMSQFGDGATSIDVRNGVVAATVEGDMTVEGSVVFLDLDGNIISSVDVGALPDMLVFTPDGNSVLVANEGEPNDDYTLDPEGSISRIDISGGVENVTQDDVITMTFNVFDNQIESLREAGVRIFGLNATVSRDLEPEYITVAEDGLSAWVSLQENNAIATIDLVNNEITSIIPLGVKNHNLPENALDVSDRNDEIFFANWDIYSMYQPDAIASYEVNGVPYVVTANEGDQREFGPINEDVDVDTDSYILDAEAYPYADEFKLDHLLGRIAVSPYTGDTDGDGDIDQIHVFGGRSFSIWNGLTGDLVYDSGSDFERITAADPVFGELFNASNSNNNFKNRSDNKGPEPEGVTVATIGQRTYAFVTLERVGGVMTYDITDPANAIFVGYDNSRTLGEGEDEGGDLGPEGIIYISPADSPNGHGMVIMANEVSATLSIYTVDPSACFLADLDNDGVVDAADLLIMLANFGCQENCIVGDFNNDGVVAIADLLIFLSGYGETCN
ncbi:choice-of-anchor I family protein [Sanyastnella coralliicola]|uniref:choice-of-anchor I family protein n=1 Tax=Sanyastnella coralliicola TaxID=3069118 RepID=UPI0027BA75FB|nr:choice-of-anchor I family protein [Longitalea sp. SCSIO 12813]